MKASMNNNCIVYNKCNHKDCESFCMRQFKLNKLYDLALFTDKQRYHVDMRLSSSQEDMNAFEALLNIERNIEDFISRGFNLYIHSRNCGNGKTQWSLRLVQAFFNKIWAKSPLKCRALFINVPLFLQSIKDNISQRSEYVQYIKDNYLSADIVVWDEIGTKELTQFEHEHILSMINSRINLGYSNIYTSNLSTDELFQSVGDRLYSRIKELSIDIELVEGDKRHLVKF